MGVVPNLVVGCWVGGEDRDIHFRSMAYGQGARAALPAVGNFLNKVFATPEFGIAQTDTFAIPNNFQFCSSDLDDLDAAPKEAPSESEMDENFR